MKKLYYILCLAAVLLFSDGCDLLMNPCGATKEEFLENYETFIKTISEANLKRNAPEWTAHDAKFEKLIKECYKEHEEEIGTVQKIEFWSNAGKYYMYRHGGDAVNVLLDKDNPVSQLILKNLDIIPGLGTVAAIYKIVREVAKSDNDMAKEAKSKFDLSTLKDLLK